MINQDGQLYEKEADVPNIGSWKCTKVTHIEGGQLRDYMGKSSDVGKLPKYETLASGSIAICVDTGDSYMYDSISKTWFMT